MINFKFSDKFKKSRNSKRNYSAKSITTSMLFRTGCRHFFGFEKSKTNAFFRFGCFLINEARIFWLLKRGERNLKNPKKLKTSVTMICSKI